MKFGILGCGRIAHTMAGTVSKMDSVECYCVAARDLDRAQAFAGEFGFAKAYGSYEEMLCDPQLDLVYIATPHSHHYEHMKLCIEHGKNILCEKSFTVNRRQAQEVLALAEEKKVFVCEAMWVRFMPLVKTLQEVVASGLIGEVTTVNSNLYYAMPNKERLWKKELAGGALLDVGIYPLTFAALFLGTQIKTISAHAIMSESGIDEQGIYTLQYENGALGFASSGIRSASDRIGTIYGTKGYIIVENINNPEYFTVYNSNHEFLKKYEAPEQITGYEYEVEGCREALEKGLLECPECPHSLTLEMMGLMDRIREEIGLVYPWDLKTEKEKTKENTTGAYCFVDGSYNIATGVYGYGGFVVAGNEKHVVSGSGQDPEMASMRNVAGEISGSQAAIEKALELGLKELTVYYDYEGVAKWASKEWKRNKKGTIAYSEFIDSVKDQIKLNFVHVKAHTGIDGNEEADRLAKKAAGVE